MQGAHVGRASASSSAKAKQRRHMGCVRDAEERGPAQRSTCASSKCLQKALLQAVLQGCCCCCCCCCCCGYGAGGCQRGICIRTRCCRCCCAATLLLLFLLLLLSPGIPCCGICHLHISTAAGPTGCRRLAAAAALLLACCCRRQLGAAKLKRLRQDTVARPHVGQALPGVEKVGAARVCVQQSLLSRHSQGTPAVRAACREGSRHPAAQPHPDRALCTCCSCRRRSASGRPSRLCPSR